MFLGQTFACKYKHTIQVAVNVWFKCDFTIGNTLIYIFFFANLHFFGCNFSCINDN